MSDTPLDWTFENIPGDDELGTPPAGTRRAPSGPPRRPLPRWVWWALPAVLVLAAAGAWGVTRVGWARLLAQVAATAAYEDERAAARDVEAVLAVQAAGADSQWLAWLGQREAQAALGLAAPLPAPNLLPTGAPPRVAALQALGDDRFAATVVRQYADSAGGVYEFELTQRYHSPEPGLWERLPADAGFLANTTVVAGLRLSATFPTADLPWFNEALPQLESALAQACLDWQCPPALRLNVQFGADAYPLSLVRRASRAPGENAYPIVFDVPPLTASYRDVRVYRLPSPHTAGYPHDERAAAALTTATSAQLLAALASELSGEGRRSPDYFFDALIARQEARLGLAPAPPVAVAPADYLAPTSLWFMTGLGELANVGDSVALRRQALGFVNFALDGQPASADAALLRALRGSNGPVPWLAAALGEAAAGAPARWRAAALGQPRAAGAHADYAGLVLACGGEALVLGAAGVHSISAQPQGQIMVSALLAPDGKRLAALIAGRFSNKLVVFNLEDGTQQPLPVAQPGVLLGWQPGGDLLFLEVHPSNGSSNVWRLMRLRQYDPTTGQYLTLLTEPVVLPWDEAGLWSPDRRTLSLALYAAGEAAAPRLALVSAGGEPAPTVAVRLLATRGYAPAFSPDGGRLAAIGGDPFPTTDHADWRVNVIDWRSNQITTVLTSQAIESGRYVEAGALAWSPDGRWLSFVALGLGSGPVAFVVPAEGGPAQRLAESTAGSVPVGFSADSRYLATLVFTGSPSTNLVQVLDLHAPPGTPPQRYLAQTAAWSPRGHALLLGGAAGLVAVDPATGGQAWLYDTSCTPGFGS